LNNCPFLGLEEDPQTLIGFSSDRNFCYRTEKPTPILLEHQQKYCLTKNHTGCPVFQDISHLTLPIEIRQPPPAGLKRSIAWRVGVAFAVILLAGMLALSWFYKPGLFALGQPAPALTIMPENTVPLGETTLPLAVHSQPTSTRELTSTLRPSSTPTGTPTPVPITSIPLGLETPSGTTPQLLIHRIVPGDNLSQLAERYGTSAAAIQSINYFLPVPLWIDLMVVIPLNTTDVSALPAFETYQVKDGSLTLKDVAWALNTSSELVSRYNLVNPTTNLLVDSWLIIPRPFPPPTGLPLATQEGKIEK
jgi:LysM repeat protein